MSEDFTRSPRRGRPPKEEQTEEMTEGSPVPASKRRRRAKVGEAAVKLKAPQRPGYIRRFAIARPDRIAELEELGYTVVSDPSIPTTGLGSGTVQRPAGTGEDGSFYRHILMETPDELYAEGRAELEEHNSQTDKAIRSRRPDQTSADELFGEGSINVRSNG